ncbi:hypothetical protein GRJ2_000786400 [Grus japonensis]|uniref:Copper transporter n=1 Tax=Grus japonensis TaxID=30415 RepID=A0ABC9WD61_GRUJA
MSPTSYKQFTLMWPVQIHLSHFNLSSLIHLIVVLMFLNGLTLGYVGTYVTRFYAQLLWPGGNICPEFGSSDTKVRAGGGGGAPGAGAEIPLQQPIEKTMVRQAGPLQLMDVDGGADIHLQPMEDPTPEQVDAPEGGCDPMGSPHWSRLLAGPVDPWREKPRLEQVCWQDL